MPDQKIRNIFWFRFVSFIWNLAHLDGRCTIVNKFYTVLLCANSVSYEKQR